MLHTLMLFLAPAAPAQAIENSPPAVAGPAVRRPWAAAATLRLALQVAGNAIGFAALFAGCWLALQLLGAFL
jgi:hypothetical protein